MIIQTFSSRTFSLKSANFSSMCSASRGIQRKCVAGCSVRCKSMMVWSWFRPFTTSHLFRPLITVNKNAGNHFSTCNKLLFYPIPHHNLRCWKPVCYLNEGLKFKFHEESFVQLWWYWKIGFILLAKNFLDSKRKSDDYTKIYWKWKTLILENLLTLPWLPLGGSLIDALLERSISFFLLPFLPMMNL